MTLWIWVFAATALQFCYCQDPSTFEYASSATLECQFGNDTIYNGTTNSNGSLVTAEGAVYPEGTWESLGDVFLVCKCVARPCFRKCCPDGQAANSSNLACLDFPDDPIFADELIPRVYREKGLVTLILENDTSSFNDHFDILYGFPCPRPWTAPLDSELAQFYLLDDGRLVAWCGEFILNASEYCFTSLDDGMLLPVVCGSPEDIDDEEEVPLRFSLYSALMLLSTPFLAATFVVYALLKRLQNVHGRCIMSHVLVLFMGYICLGTVGFYRHIDRVACSIFAFIIYFAFLASFFWLNVMCLDIWWTFSGFRPMRGSVKEREHKKFIIYSLYCWGSPLIMLIICMVMDLHPDIPDTYIKPGFGEVKCWFRSTTANLLYFTGPTAILIVCNIVLFIFTSVKIRQVKRGTKILKKQDSRRHNEEEENNTQRFNLYLKLFLVMGVNWIMEIVSFAAGGPDEWWYVTDIANTLQGVLIFIIFVWKDRIRKLLAERFRPGRAANNSFGNSSSTRTTGIRHNGSINTRPSIRNKEDCQMKTLTSPSARSDESDVA